MIIFVSLKYNLWEITLRQQRSIQLFIALIKTQVSCVIKTLQTYIAIRYVYSKLFNLLSQHDILFIYRCYLSISKHNNFALILVPLNKKIVHKASKDTFKGIIHILFFIFASCFEWYWGKATFTVVYTINCIPTIITSNQRLYECVCGKLFYYNILQVFESTCFVFL